MSPQAMVIASPISRAGRTARSPISFHDSDVFDKLERATDAALDALDFGVIGMFRDGRVCRYNRWEALLSGVHPSRALGKSFFAVVAPWTNNRRIALRFMAEQNLDDTFDCTFELPNRPTLVRLRLVRPICARRMYLLVAQLPEA